MGNDGGTIAKKQDLLSLYSRDALSANHQRKLDDNGTSVYNSCTLTSLPLHDIHSRPVFSDYKGRLYLKEKVLESLIEQKIHKKQLGLPSHINTIHDLVELKITWNKSTDSAKSMTISCPLTQSRGPFAYLRTCGCVMSYKFLQELAKSHLKDTKEEDACPLCESRFNIVYDIVIINPENEQVHSEVNEKTFSYLQNELKVSHSKKPLKKHSKGLKRSKNSSDNNLTGSKRKTTDEITNNATESKRARAA